MYDKEDTGKSARKLSREIITSERSGGEIETVRK